MAVQPHINTVNLVAQCGLMPSSEYRLRNGYLGTKYSIPTKVGRISQRLSWSDSHIIIRKEMAPVASPELQQFLEATAATSENTFLDYSKHPSIHITYPKRVVKERVYQTINYNLLTNESKYDVFVEPNNETNFKPREPSDDPIRGRFSSSASCPPSPRNNSRKKKAATTHHFRRRRQTDEENFDLSRPISLTSIIERENTHVSKNPRNYLYWTNSPNQRYNS